MRVLERGEGIPVGIVGVQHGNEHLGAEVIELLPEIPGVRLTLIVANEEALAQDTRFLESDLNRSFPGDPEGDLEHRLAHKVLNAVKHCDFVIDIHSTVTDTPAFVAHVEDNDFLKAVPLPRLVEIRPPVAQGGALIEHKRGFGLEFPETTKPQAVVDLLLEFFDNLRHGKTVEQEHFACVEILKGDATFSNFEPVELHGETFYPILSGERGHDGQKAYIGVSALLCKKR